MADPVGSPPKQTPFCLQDLFFVLCNSAKDLYRPQFLNRNGPQMLCAPEGQGSTQETAVPANRNSTKKNI